MQGSRGSNRDAPILATEAGLTLGVEEEFLLVDPRTGWPVPRAAEVLARCADADPAGWGRAQPEMRASQVEVATGVCRDATGLAAELTTGRRVLAGAAAEVDVMLVASGTPVLTGPLVPPSPGDRYGRIERRYRGVVADYQACGCHVHVGVPDRELAVSVVNHLRLWLPTLLALSVNSPFHAGRDTGCASWRIVQLSRFPGSGVPPWFPSAAAHDAEVARLVDCGVLVDDRMTFWLARPSPWLPTVEIRAGDAAAEVPDALLQALLVRALVRTALADLARGRTAEPVPDQVMAAALWAAARDGLAGQGVDPLAERQVPALALLRALLGKVRPELVATGDLGRVRALLRRLARCGTGADRQRRAAEHGLTAVVTILAAQTNPSATLKHR